MNFNGLLYGKIVNGGVAGVAFVRRARIKFAFGRAFNARKSVGLISSCTGWFVMSLVLYDLTVIISNIYNSVCVCVR